MRALSTQPFFGWITLLLPIAEPSVVRAARAIASGGQPMAAAASVTSLSTVFGRAPVGNCGAGVVLAVGVYGVYGVYGLLFPMASSNFGGILLMPTSSARRVVSRCCASSPRRLPSPRRASTRAGPEARAPISGGTQAS